MNTRKPKWTVKVSEGDCYAVPLKSGGFGVGVVARKGKRGALFGYFFGPRREQIPTISDVRAIRAETADLCALFGDLGIQNGEWIHLGQLEGWDSND
jgi:hypothetical protein